MELWLVDLEAAAPALEALEHDVPRLSADDRDRAGRLSDPREKRYRLAAYAALRVVLERVGGPGVRGQRFLRPAGGKPRLRDGPAFSLSHAGRLALVGVAQAQTIGVDLEETRAVSMSQRRREEILAVGVGLAAQPLHRSGGDVALLQAWCRLEAYAKARGHGVARALSELGLREARGRQIASPSLEVAARRLAREAGLAVGDVKLAPGLHGAVAYAGGGAHPPLRRFPAEPRAIARLLLHIRAAPSG